MRKSGGFAANDQRLVAVDRPPPEPPPDLTGVEADIWRGIVGAVASDWFGPETRPLLVEMCRHAGYARELAAEITAVRVWLDKVATQSSEEAPPSKEVTDRRRELYALLRAHGYQSERIGNLGTKLRLTQSSRLPSTTARSKPPPSGPSPWALIAAGEQYSRRFDGADEADKAKQ